MTAEDVIWRRSKLGLRLAPEDIARIDAFLQEQASVEAA
jgi:glycerol-3-phosphate dehydrogenase